MYIVQRVRRRGGGGEFRPWTYPGPEYVKNWRILRFRAFLGINLGFKALLVLIMLCEPV